MRKRWLVIGAAILTVLAVGSLTAQTLIQEIPYHLAFRQNNPQLRYNGTLQFQSLSGTTKGTAPTHYAASISPAAIAAGASGSEVSSEQTFNVDGVLATDKVFINGPAPTAACPPVHARVSAAGSVVISYLKSTTAVCTPATGTYHIITIGGAS